MAEDVTPEVGDTPLESQPVSELVGMPEMAVGQQPQSSLMARLRSIFGSQSRSRRLLDLEWAIEEFPDAPANYVLRGEVYLEANEYALAVMDFEQGLALAAEQFANADWGLVAQVLQDRALNGLEKARRRLAR